MSGAAVFWFSGLSGAGKSTVAEGAKKRLIADGYRVLTLDGDDVRRRLHKDLGFSEPEIKENNRLISELCARYRDQWDAILVPIISPYAVSRKRAGEFLGEGFYEIHFSAALDVVENRDAKGLYAKARRGEMDNLIGFSANSPYEPPENPDLTLDTGVMTPEDAIEILRDFIRQRTMAGIEPPQLNQ